MKDKIFYKNNKWFYNDEEMSMEEAFECYSRCNLYYEFYINNKQEHCHYFKDVLKRVYDYPDTFKIRDNQKKYYNETEYEFILKLQNKLLNDDYHDIDINFEKNKRGYQILD